MLQPPPLKSLPRYPVTASIGGAALVVTALWWTGCEIDALFMTADVSLRWELWRALTSTLPHVNFFHLAFNLYWFWALGTILERAYGHFRYLGIILFLAVGSSLAEFTVLQGGVGLSGVGYGLWAMLWVLERRDPRFAGVLDPQTSRIFVIWFFLCIGLTLTNVMPVGNIAHGMGAALGALFGIACTSSGAIKLRSIIAAALVIFLGLAGSTVLWPRLNISQDAQSEVERAGVEALGRSDNGRAIRLLKLSAHMKRAPARAWFNLGIAYHRLGNYEAALAAYQHAAGMPDATPDMQQAAQEVKDYQRAKQAFEDSRRR